MSEITRDELRRACEAVGWPTSGTGTGFVVKTPYGWHGQRALRTSNRLALSLLEEAARAFQVCFNPNYGKKPWKVVMNPGLADEVGATLPEAAVRAVLAWAEGKETKGREGVA